MMSENRTIARISPIQMKPEMKIKTLSDPDVEKIHTVFVASFIGATNIFLGKIVSKKNAKIELETKAWSSGSGIFTE